MDLEEFTKIFEKWLLTKGNDGFHMTYMRASFPNKFDIWVQSHLDKIGMKSADFKLTKGKLVIENEVYYGVGELQCPYEIIYDSNEKIPDNIKKIKLKI